MRFIKATPLSSDLPLITESHEILHHDEEAILFTGINRYGSRVLGSFVEKDHLKDEIRYFHTVITSADFAAFLNQRRTYRQILQTAQPLFVIEDNPQHERQTVSTTVFEDLPEEYQPTERSYCPEQPPIASENYVAALEGGIADNQLAQPDNAGRLQTLWADLLEVPLMLFSELEPAVYLQPAASGSFRINYEIRLGIRQQVLFASRDEYLRFAHEYLRFCLNHFAIELNQVLQQKTPHHYARLLTIYLRLIGAPNNTVGNDLQQSLASAANILEDIAGHVGEGFSRVSLASFAHGQEQVLGVVDNTFAASIELTAQQLAAASGNQPTEDERPTEYRIVVYHLNTETRHGNAWIRDTPTSDTWSRPRFTIEGDYALEGTKFTESLHFDKEIPVKAIARRIGTKYKHLRITEQDKTRTEY